MLKWRDLKCSCPEGKTVHIQMLSAESMIDAWREGSDCKCAYRHTHTYTRTLNMCICVSQGFSLNISKGQERKQRENGYPNLEQ